jgi:hypothetical protein
MSIRTSLPSITSQRVQSNTREHCFTSILFLFVVLSLVSLSPSLSLSMSSSRQVEIVVESRPAEEAVSSTADSRLSAASGPEANNNGLPSDRRRRSSVTSPHRLPHDGDPVGRPRRPSTFSAYSIISEANRTFQDEIAHPGSPTSSPSTWWPTLALAFGLVPPFVGIFFKNGAAFCNDVILLFLSGVLLHWSTTTPW